MRRYLALATLGMALATSTPTYATEPTASTAPHAVDGMEIAPLSELVSQVHIPSTLHRLDNGLQVIIHEDHRVPLVEVSTWYHVGSVNEQAGKTGFAHLYEHIMGYGSEHVPGGVGRPLTEAGAVAMNANTSFDRTHYFAVAPKDTLDLQLMLRSDQMGYLLGGVTQDTLTNQIGVVQNEKRQGDNRPYFKNWYEIFGTLFPEGHPYHHMVIGSMEDIGSASLEDVKAFFRNHYGPNNAVLVISGDVNTAEALAKVQKWFGEIPRGPDVKALDAPIPTLPATVAKTNYDRIPTPRVSRYWAVPGLDNPDYLPLAIAGTILGGLASSRLDDELVRGEEIATGVSAYSEALAHVGLFGVIADVKPGVDPATVEAALDRELARLIAEGPSEDEMLRAKTAYAGSAIRDLDQLGGYSGKGNVLAEGLLYSDDPEHYKTELADIAALTAEDVRTALAKWLSRPAFELTTLPGDPDDGASSGGPAAESLPVQATMAWEANPALPSAAATTFQAAPDRSTLPSVGEPEALTFPAIQRATLSNGMKVHFIPSHNVPVVSLTVSFDAGYAADPRDALGTQTLLLSLMNQGTGDYDASEWAAVKERLGASIGGSTSWDVTEFSLNALSPNLAPSLELLASYIREPAMQSDDLERVRAQQLSAISREINDPGELAKRALYPLVYGANHPYGIPPSGLGELDAVEAVTLDDLKAFHNKWLRPDIATIYAVGDTTLPELTALLEQSFGDWQAPATAAPTKDYSVALPERTERIVLIDRPGSQQSVIRAARVIDTPGTEDQTTIRAANQVLGGSSQSRIFQNLRQQKGWAYTPWSAVTMTYDRPLFFIDAPVQADRTGDSIALLRDELREIGSDRPVTADEGAVVRNSNLRSLPGLVASSGDLLSEMEALDLYDRPDDYHAGLAAKYEALTPEAMTDAARNSFPADQILYLVVGDAKVVMPQIEPLGIPIVQMEAPAE